MNQSISNTRSRRRFMGELSCSSIGMGSLLSSLINLRLTGSLAAAEEPAEGDYKALVCLFLAGGNDSYNMLAPVDDDGYAQYATAREGLALPKEDFVALPGALPTPDGRTLGLHNEMSELHSLYSSGKAAFVANVGTLVEPTTLTAMDNGTAKLPLGLFSHSDQQLHWQSGLPDSRSPLQGWGSRMADLVNSLNGESGVSMNVSLSGINMLQSGGSTALMTRSSTDIVSMSGWGTPSFATREASVRTLLDAEYRNIFERTFASSKKDAIAVSAEYKEALSLQDPLATVFTPENALSQDLKAIAETIAARGPLCKRRQTFFVQMDGWDHHGSLADHPTMLGTVSQAIGEFQAAMVELGLEDDVTLFSASDFGRTLSTNGGGSDHAWGGNQFVVGGAVNGGQIYGQYPELALGSILDTGRGRFIPTTSVDEYAADLALWMGVSPSNLNLVLPNLPEFYDTLTFETNGPPLGIMASE